MNLEIALAATLQKSQETELHVSIFSLNLILPFQE